jgi:hypothetical protein
MQVTSFLLKALNVKWFWIRSLVPRSKAIPKSGILKAYGFRSQQTQRKLSRIAICKNVGFLYIQSGFALLDPIGEIDFKYILFNYQIIKQDHEWHSPLLEQLKQHSESL